MKLVDMPPIRRKAGIVGALLGITAACSFMAPPDDEYVRDAAQRAGGPAGANAGAGGGKAGEGSGGTVANAGGSLSADAGSGGSLSANAGSGTGGAEEPAGGMSQGGEDAGAGGQADCRVDDGECDCDDGQHACHGTCVRNDSTESCGDGCSPCPEPMNGQATCDGVSCALRCDVGFSPCGAACVDLRTDRENCGGCGAEFACTGDAVCQAGRCVSVSGCSDGTREGFDVAGAYLAIAGCAANWPMGSMRAAKTGMACGVGSATCNTPADACGVGWHVCASPPYGPGEISARATLAECLAQPGAYAAAVGDQTCEPCAADGAGAACCGQSCVQQNGSCIYPGMTPWFGVYEGHINRCGEIESRTATRGVLCCLDG